MDGASVLITDSSEGLCVPILEFLQEKKAIPFVLVKDFELVPEISDNFLSACPIVLNALQNVESAKDHLSALPTVSCIFNLDGEMFENLYRQTFDHFTRTISIYKVDFNINQVHTDILEAISEGYTLIINLIPLPLSGATLLTTTDSPGNAIITANMGATHEQLLILEKLFFRKSQRIRVHTLALPPIRSKTGRESHGMKTIPGTSTNPISILLKKWFSRFNPCAATPVLSLIPRSCPLGAAGGGVKSPQEINKYIRTQQSVEIKQTFHTIHEGALKNWTKICEENFTFNQSYQKQFQEMCEEIQRKGEEGRRALLDKVKKDLERTRQFDHVLGEKAIQRIRQEKEKEIDLKVQQFFQRKMVEAKEKMENEIRQARIRTKSRFYREILDEQMMELTQIKEKFQKRKDLLMLPYTGELNILRKC